MRAAIGVFGRKGTGEIFCRMVEIPYKVMV